MVWSTVMEQAIGALRNEKISLGLLAVVLFLAGYAYTWAGGEHDNLVSKTEFQELTTLMIGHTEEFRIVNASQLIRDLEMQLDIAAATGKTESEIAHIKTDIKEARLYRSCLIDRRPNCKHLMPSSG